MSDGARGVHGLVSIGEKAFGIRKELLRKFAKKLEGRRVIFLVDDLDRAHPAIVPKVLFWIREILDLPGLSFVLAFDPDRVVSALQHEHPGFSGREFFDKILDFQWWIPELDPKRLLHFALQEAAKHAPYLPAGVIRGNAVALPSTPRAIRALFRHLRVLAPEVERHRPSELSFGTLFLCEVMRVGWPQFLSRLCNEPTIFQMFVVRRMAMKSPAGSVSDPSTKDDPLLDGSLSRIWSAAIFVVSRRSLIELLLSKPDGLPWTSSTMRGYS